MLKIFNIILITILYLTVILLSVFLNIQGEIKYKRGKRFAWFYISIIAILIPCFLAAFRGETVGNDVLVYAEPCYFLAKNTNSLTELLGLKTRFEYGYLILGYISSHIFHSFNAMLFLTQLLINTPIYIGAHKFRNRIPAWSTLLCFYYFFYIETFNIMRQGIAVALLFLAMAEFLEGKKKWTIVCTVMAIFFHNTAIIGAVLLLFVLVLRRIKNNQLKVVLSLLIVIAVPVAMSRWSIILTALSSLGIIKARYANYIGYMGGKAYFTQLGLGNYLELIARWLGCLIPFTFARYGQRTIKQDDFEYSLGIGTFLATMIYTAVFIWLHSSYGYRVSFYLEILFILWMGTLVKRDVHINLRKAHLGTVIMLTSSFMCFFIIYMWRGMHGTLPFYFQLYDF